MVLQHCLHQVTASLVSPGSTGGDGGVRVGICPACDGKRQGKGQWHWQALVNLELFSSFPFLLASQRGERLLP